MVSRKNDETAGDPFAELRRSLAGQRAVWAARETIGERFTVPREGKAGVKTILHRPQAAVVPGTRLPVVVNMHGGAWTGGDAVLMETFCRLLADELPALVINVNYTKADEASIPYAIDEIVDVIRYFAAHGAAHGIDPGKMVVGGHSAGAHLACCADFVLAQEGFRLRAQMLVYPVADMTANNDGFRQYRSLWFPDGGWDLPHVSPLHAPAEMLEKVSPAIFILCGRDTLRSRGLAYAKRLLELGVEVKVREYRDAEHGFLEVNRPDYPQDDPRVSPEQAAMARDCEAYLIRELRATLDL